MGNNIPALGNVTLELGSDILSLDNDIPALGNVTLALDNDIPALVNDNQALGNVTLALGTDILPAMSDNVAAQGNDIPALQNVITTLYMVNTGLNLNRTRTLDCSLLYLVCMDMLL